jgi:arylsulfatase A-like enzyme
LRRCPATPFDSHAGVQIHLAFITAAVIIGSALVGCGAPTGPSIVLITIDGALPERTPHLDGFAADAVVYERAYATSSRSLASHASMMTGLLPMQHGAQRDHEQLRPLSADAVTLAEHLLGAGYRTAGFVSNPDLRIDSRISQGFRIYDDDGGLASEVTDRALQVVTRFASEEGTGPYFLFVNFIANPASDVDVHLGRLLPSLDGALVVITSGHGARSGVREASMEFDLYEESVRVPLLVRHPDLRGASTEPEVPVQNHRLFGTILSAVPATASSAIAENALGGPSRLIVTEVHDRSGVGLRALYLRPYKLIQSTTGASEFYDLDRDPRESIDISVTSAKPYSRALKMLAQLSNANPPLYDAARSSSVWPATIEKLNALGTVE